MSVLLVSVLVYVQLLPSVIFACQQASTAAGSGYYPSPSSLFPSLLPKQVLLKVSAKVGCACRAGAAAGGGGVLWRAAYARQ